MKDEIIYCSNIEQLKLELINNGFYDEESNSFTHGNNLTPIKRNVSGASLSLVRDNKLNLDDFPSLTNLGTYDEVFADIAKDDLYKSVYPYDIPISYVDEDGVIQTRYLPKYIGVFA